MKLFHRKNKAVKNWRSRAWSIDPKVTNLTIIKTEAANLELLDLSGADLDFHHLFTSYPQYFDAITDIEQFCL